MTRIPPAILVSTICLCTICLTLSAAVAAEPALPVEAKLDKTKGTLTILARGKEAFVYQFAPTVDLPHLFPLRSPSGKNMLVQKTQPYPHHRAFWFADTVRLAGQKRTVSFYNAYYSKQRLKLPDSKTFPDRIRHVRFEPDLAAGLKTKTGEIEFDCYLVWEMHPQTPVLDEKRHVRVRALPGGEYFLDITFTVTATYGDVQILSDAVHYAWPYVRMNKTFNVKDGGGTMTNSAGGINQKGTHGKVADWVDYSCTVEGVTEGLTVFSHPGNPRPHKWLTRDYGTFGPRRIDTQSGNKKMVLKKGKSLSTRVGVYVHTGDVKTAKVAEMYTRYAAGKL